MSEITKAIAARQTQITQIQSDIETLQRAASIVDGKTKAAAKAASQAKAPAKSKAKPQPKPKAQGKRRQWSAAEKADEGVLGEAAEGQGASPLLR